MTYRQQLQETTLEFAQVQVGDFSFEGGFFASPNGSMTFMLTLKGYRKLTAYQLCAATAT